MKLFEIHITGEKKINEELSALNIKNIIVDLLYPDLTLLRTEYMSSFIIKKESYNEVEEYIIKLLKQLTCEIIRVKVETPYYTEYLDKALYLESHFKPFNDKYPISNNAKSNKLLATDRTYNKTDFDNFINKWKNEDVEMCIYDSYVTEDKDWFDLYR